MPPKSEFTLNGHPSLDGMKEFIRLPPPEYVLGDGPFGVGVDLGPKQRPCAHCNRMVDIDKTRFTGTCYLCEHCYEELLNIKPIKETGVGGKVTFYTSIQCSVCSKPLSLYDVKVLGGLCERCFELHRRTPIFSGEKPTYPEITACRVCGTSVQPMYSNMRAGMCLMCWDLHGGVPRYSGETQQAPPADVLEPLLSAGSVPCRECGVPVRRLSFMRDGLCLSCYERGGRSAPSLNSGQPTGSAVMYSDCWKCGTRGKQSEMFTHGNSYVCAPCFYGGTVEIKLGGKVNDQILPKPEQLHVTVLDDMNHKVGQAPPAITNGAAYIEKKTIARSNCMICGLDGAYHDGHGHPFCWSRELAWKHETRPGWLLSVYPGTPTIALLKEIVLTLPLKNQKRAEMVTWIESGFRGGDVTNMCGQMVVESLTIAWHTRAAEMDFRGILSSNPYYMAELEEVKREMSWRLCKIIRRHGEKK